MGIVIKSSYGIKKEITTGFKKSLLRTDFGTTPVMHLCGVCGTPLVIHTCFMIQKICKECGNQFVAKHAKRLYCGAKCAAAQQSNYDVPFREWSSERKLKYNAAMRLNIQRKKQMVYDLLGNKCMDCGFSDVRALQIDHVNGGGVRELRSHGGNRKSYYVNVFKSLTNKEGKYQLLCANCNWIKRHEKNER